MKRVCMLLVLVGVCSVWNTGKKANAEEPILGEIRMFAGNFAPRGWAFCDGRRIRIDQNLALFSLLGTTYGGDGRTTFALPDLRGRAPIHAGRGPGLTHRRLGEKGGAESVMSTEVFKVAKAEVDNASTASVPLAGKGQNMSPYTTVHFIIALHGLYPSRN